jgi:hypothetical protein
MLVFWGDKLLPGLFGMTTQNPIKVGVQLQIVGVQIMEQLFRSKNLCNLIFDKLIIIVVPVEEWFFTENHPRKHAS